MPDEDKQIYSTSETIGVVEQRKLIEFGRAMNRMLTMNEYVLIMRVYDKAIDRLMKESGEVLE